MRLNHQSTGLGGLFWSLAALTSPASGLLDAPRLERTARRRAGLADALARALALLTVWSERRRSRRALMRLDDRLLKDIGLTRSDVEAEWEKPFWRT